MSEKTAIEKFYEDEKSRGFVNHLIHAYLPTYKVTKVWDFKDKKRTYKCSVCGHELIDAVTVLSRVENTDYIQDSIHQLVEEYEGKVIERKNRAVVKHITHGAILAWTGEKTDTKLCQSCIQHLLDLVSLGLIMGDQNITYQVNKMKRNAMFESFTSSPALNPSEINVVEKIQKKIEKNPKHVTTFGDLEVLQNLKKKMEEDEKKKKH